MGHRKIRTTRERTTKENEKPKLKVLFWNAQSLETKLDELKMKVNELHPTVIAVVETWYTGNERYNIGIKGYTHITKNREEGRGGGIQILVQDPIPFQEIPLRKFNQGKMETLYVEIKGEETINLLTCYYPKNDLKTQEWEHYVNQISGHTLIVGDFNSHHQMWEKEDHETNQSGKTIFQFLNDNPDFSLLTPRGLVTRTDPRTGKGSTIDLVMGTQLFHKSQVSTLEEINSDHLPIWIEPEVIIHQEMYRRARWKMESRGLTDFQRTLGSKGEARDFKEIIEQMQEAAEQTLQKTKDTKKVKSRKPWWDQEIEDIIKEKHAAYNKFRKTYQIGDLINYKRLKAKARNMIKKKKAKSFGNFCSNLTFNTSNSVVWQFIRKMNGNVQSNCYRLKKQGEIIANDQEKANFMLEFFKTKLSKQTQLTLPDDWENAIERKEEEQLNRNFNMEELEYVIKNLKNGKATGEDGITNEMIKNMPRNKKEELLKTINRYWEQGKFPEEGKTSIIVPLLKANKDASKPESYRPVTLLSCIGKVYEAMVNRRLTWFLETKRIMPNNMLGFRPGKATIDALRILEHEVNDTYNKQEYLIAVFIDIRGAFDAVDHSVLLKKALKMGISGKMLNFLKDYLSDRKYKILIGKTYSEEAELNNGTPQGSPLSPTVFNIMMHDIPQSEDSKKTLWADDVFMLTRGIDLEALLRLTQIEVDELNRWCQESLLEINTDEDKSNCMIYTKRRIRIVPRITIDGKEVKFTKQKKYLGLIWNGPSLNWSKHIEYIIKTCAKRIDVMKRMTNLKYGCKRRTMIKYYQAYIQSRINYGLCIYGSANKNLIVKIQTVQNNALRIATGAIKTSPIISLQAETGLLPIEMVRKNEICKWTWKFAVKDVFSPLLQVNLRELAEVGTITRKESFTQRSQKLLNEIGETSPPITHLPALTNLPTWESVDRYTTSTLGYPDIKKLSNEHIKSIFLEKMENEYKGWNKIFTDGSRNSQTNQSSASIYVEENKIAKMWKLPTDTNILTCELVAIKMAIDYAKRNLQKKCVILTDSQSGVKAINNRKPKTNKKLIFETQEALYEQNKNNPEKQIKIQWVPGHSNICGNEVADKAAKLGLIQQEEHFIVPDIQTKEKIIKKKWRIQWETKMKQQIQGKHYTKINPTLTRSKNLGDKNRKMDVCLTRLRIGHSRLAEHLHRMKIVDDPMCRYCAIEEENITHIVFRCARFHSLQVELKDKLRKEGIPHTKEVLLGGGTLTKRQRRIATAQLKQFLTKSGVIDII